MTSRIQPTSLLSSESKAPSQPSLSKIDISGLTMSLLHRFSTDVGLRALHHLNPRSFLDKAAALDDLSPRFGTSVKGIDVTSLSSDELDQLALYVAERGVVVLEDQHAFINQSPEKIKEFGRHFSPRLHQHQVSGQPRDHPEFHLIYKSHKVELNNCESKPASCRAT